MKILCQERYEKAVAYAKEIKNDTLQKCIDRLKQWEQNPNCPCEIELYYDSAPSIRQRLVGIAVIEQASHNTSSAIWIYLSESE